MAKDKSSNPTANKKLSALENKLLEYAKKGQPVLLYGKDTLRNGREGLVNYIYTLSGGKGDDREYTGSEKNINSPDDLLKAIGKAHKKQDIEKEARLLLDYNDAFLTYMIVDFDCKSGKDIYEKLSCFECQLFLEPLSCIKGILIQNFNIDNIIKSENNIIEKPHSIQYYMSDTKEYIQRKGLFFLNNLRCDPEDNKWYERLAKKIEDRRRRDIASDGSHWLIAYTHNPEPFPEYFKEQFEQVSLDDEKYDEEGQENADRNEKRVLPKLSIMDDKKNVLYFDKANSVRLTPKEIKLINYMCEQTVFELAQILTEFFKKTLSGTNNAISKEERNIFDTYTSNINRKCKTLGIGDIIVKHGKVQKAFKLSIKIRKKNMSL